MGGGSQEGEDLKALARCYFIAGPTSANEQSVTMFNEAFDYRPNALKYLQSPAMAVARSPIPRRASCPFRF
jgi:hypothetical protein